MNIVNFEELKQELKIAKENAKILEVSHSEIDKLENTILHQIENATKTSASEGYKFFKALQETRVKRRMIKEQLAEQHCIVNKLKPFIDSMEGLNKGLTYSKVGGKKKYVKDFSDINIKLDSIKTL